MDLSSLARRLKERAREQGFDLVGIAPAGDADGFRHLQDWLAQGFAGDMRYLERHEMARRHPESILPQVRSVVMLAMNYAPKPRDEVLRFPGVEARTKIARYALGADYHDVLRDKLNALLTWVQTQNPHIQGRGVVDTAPLLERDFARRAGLGWFGKNTMLLNKSNGSYFFLAALLLDVELPTDAPFETSHCGTCTRCLDACPTDAFPTPYQLDARKCISYLTIELKDHIPEALRPGVGDWLFGCDICQEVCPWNRKAPPTREPAFQPRPGLMNVDPLELFQLSEEEFRARFRDTPLWRTKRRGLLRNAAIVLGNRGDPRALPVLQAALSNETDPVIVEAVRWAIQCLQ